VLKCQYIVWQLSLIWPRLLVIGNQSAAEAALIKAPSGEWSWGSEQRHSVAVCSVCVLRNKYVVEQNLVVAG